MGGHAVTFRKGDRWVRRCYICGEIKDLERDYYRSYKDRELPRGRAYECKVCKSRKGTEREQRLRAADPERAGELRKMYRESSARIRAKERRNPKLRRIKNENARIDAQLRAEREGRRRRKSPPVEMPSETVQRMPRLPATPFACYLDRLIAKRNEPRSGPLDIATPCAELGVSPRSLADWRTGRRRSVTFDIVDRVLIATGASWMDIWPKEDYPEVWEALG